MALPYDVDGTWAGSAANPVSYDAGELRRADAAMFSSAGIASGLAVSVDGSDVVTIQPGQAVISGEDAVAGTGVYRAGIASAVTGSLAARDATNGRIDLVVFRQMDTDVVPAHAARTSRLQIIAGTPSATPAVPTRPSMAVELARISVPASGGGAASVDSSYRAYAVALNHTLIDAILDGVVNTTLSTGWAAEIGGLVKTFVGPLSGRVKVTVSAYLTTNTTNSREDFGFMWSGGMSRNPNDNETLSIFSATGASALQASRVFTVAVTPGTSYTLTSAVRNQVAASATVGVSLRGLIVEAI